MKNNTSLVQRLCMATLAAGALWWMPAQAQSLKTGDIAFVGLNAEGQDDIAFVSFVDIPAGTVIYFCDSELNANGQFGTDEGDFAWNSGTAVIPKGTVVAINALDGNTTVSHGFLQTDNSGGFSPNGDAMFAFLGTGARQPTTFLAAIGNANGVFGDLSKSGLTIGSTAIQLPNSTAIAIYSGPRAGRDANGYLTALNIFSNWRIQENIAGGNEWNDGIDPDMPFNTEAFTISTIDVTPPAVANVTVVDASTVEVAFTEAMSNATFAAAYRFTPTLAISSVQYDAQRKTATIRHAGFESGRRYSLRVSGLSDVAENAMPEPFNSGSLYYNTGTPSLIFTEIMYNPPGDNSDALEFLEIYNAGTTPAVLGGITVRDESNFVYTFEESSLPAGGFVLLATDKATADNFYKKTFIDVVAGTINALGNGGEALVIRNSAGVALDSVAYDDALPWATEPDGQGPSLELLDAKGNRNDGGNWRASSTFVANNFGVPIFASPGAFVQSVGTSSVAFSSDNSVSRVATVQIPLRISAAADRDVTARLSVLSDFSTIEAELATTEVVFPAGSSAELSAALTFTAGSRSGYAAIAITEVVDGVPGSVSTHIAYYRPEAYPVPTASKALDIELVNSFRVSESGTAEIVAFEDNRLFVLNSTDTKVEVFDFADPRNPAKIASLDMKQYGEGATSVAVKNGLVAASVDGAAGQPGKVVFLNRDGVFQRSVEVGYLPDMVTFSPDGRLVLTSNEGEPSSDYTFDPEGTVSVIDVSGGVASIDQSKVSTVAFTQFNSQREQLTAAGVRIYGPNATVAQDLEPEYITISDDSRTAWVTLQENNAVAVIDIPSRTATAILPLGTKDHMAPGNELDASDRSGEVLIGSWPIRGMYQPDAIAQYTVGGKTYLVTANEGDARDYDAYAEEARVSALPLDPEKFPDAALLKKAHALGRMTATTASGDTDGDGDYDEIHVLGARSFSIWDASAGTLVYDSGSDFERITAMHPEWSQIFNVSNDDLNPKSRSDNKGPEPEGVAVAEILGRHYAFIALERIGGIMVYDITNPASPSFVDYQNNRSKTEETGDLGPEGIIYLAPEVSPTDTALVVIANEVSATVSVYALKNVFAPPTSVEEQGNPTSAVQLYPNPATGDRVVLSAPSTWEVFSVTGEKVAGSSSAGAIIPTGGLPNGMYVVKFGNGSTTSLIISR